MKTLSRAAAEIAQPTPHELAFSGSWPARGIGPLQPRLAALRLATRADVVADAAGIEALDTAGAWVLQKLLLRLLACDEMQGFLFSKPEPSEIFETRFLAAAAPDGKR